MAQPLKPEIRDLPLATLKPAPYNPRRIDDAAIAALTKSLERFGYVEPIIWNERTGYVVGGHQRLKVLKAAKVESVPVVVVDLNETDEKALNVALNSPHLTGEFTDDLQALLAEIQGADSALFNELRLDELLGEIAASGGDPDRVPPIPQEAKTQRGDLYELGDHRLLCGDSTEAGAISLVVNLDRPNLVFTDPPYGIAYAVKAAAGPGRMVSDARRAMASLRIENDATQQEAETVLRGALALLSEAEAIFVCCDWRSMPNVCEVMESVGAPVKACIVWDKGGPYQHLDRFAKGHELILYSGPFGGEKTVGTDVWKVTREFRDDHPTPKPVELVQTAIRSASNTGAVVVDPFAGSGSTLIACEATGRQCRAIELDPLYCDVIVQRWEEYTGRKAVLHRGNG